MFGTQPEAGGIKFAVFDGSFLRLFVSDSIATPATGLQWFDSPTLLARAAAVVALRR